MDPFLVGILGIAGLLILLFLGVPIGFAMGIVGVAGFAVVVNPLAAFRLISTDIFTNLNSYSLSALPMFVLMGSMAFAAGLGRRAYDAVYILMGPLRGGLLVATSVASAIFGAVCGSGAATNVAIGKIAIPELRKRGYQETISLGCVACSGTLGFMIPPSGVFIIYGILTEQSIGKLFIAGVLPGILITFLFVVTTLLICWFKPTYGPASAESFSLKQRLRALLGLTDAAVLFLLVMGGLFAGWFSPTSAGAIGTAGAVVIGVVRRELTLKKLIEGLRESLRLTCMIFMLIIGAMLFGHFITVSGFSQALLDWVRGAGLPPLGIIAFVTAVFFIFGLFIDIMPLLLLLVPLFYPTIVESGYDLIWFGVIAVTLCMVGIVSPPVGTNIYVTKGLAGDVKLGVVFKGCLIYLIPLIIGLIILILFPKISLWLPSIMSY